MASSPFDDEPTLDHIRTCYQTILRDSGVSAQRKIDEELLRFYFDEHAIPVPNTAGRDRSRRIDPERLSVQEAPRAIDQIVSYYPQWPTLGAQFTGSGSFSETRIEQAGRALNEMFDQLNPAVGDQPWTEGVFWQALLGRSADLVLSGEQYYWDFPFKREDETEEEARERRQEWRRNAPLPMVWYTLPPQNTFPSSLGAVNDEVISWQIMSGQEVADIFGPGSVETFEPSNHTVVIYSNRRWIAFALLADRPTGGFAGSPLGARFEDRWLREPQEHGLGRSAIRIIPGMTTGRREYPYLWKSLLWTSRSLIKAADRLASIVATGARFDAFPLLAAKVRASSDGKGSKGQIEMSEEGDILFLDAGDGTTPAEDIKGVFQPQFGQHARELLVWVVDRIARNVGATEAMEGIFGPSGQSAWARNYSAEMARNKLRPFTSAVIGRALDIAETLSLAVISFDEPVVLAKLDEQGNRKGDIVLQPDDLRKVRPILKGEYKVQIPVNRRADLSLAVDMLLKAKKGGIIIDPKMVYEELMGVEDFWSQVYHDWLELEYMTSDEVRRAQLADIAAKFEANVARQKGMSVEELDQLAQSGRLPPLAVQLLRQLAQAKQRGAATRRGNGALPGGLTPEAQGAIRAGAPLSTPAGGPLPQEEYVP